jgi:Tol biopolymer transport system component
VTRGRVTSARFAGAATLLWIWAVSGVGISSAAVGPAPMKNGTIAYETRRHGNAEIFEIQTNGAHVSNVTQNPADESSADWSRNGRRLAVVTDRDGNPEIYRLDARGAHPKRLTNDPATDGAPSWSPDGSKIAFETDRDGNREIYVMDADGTDPLRLTNDSASDAGPTWSPNGNKIAFTSDRDGNSEIYVMDAADGNNQTNLTNDPSEDVNPDWSPNSNKIVFWSDRAGSRDIFVMSAADGSGQTNLTHRSSDDSAPAWSPEGKRIAFESDRAGNGEIYVMKADGTHVLRVTNRPGADKDPVWDPLPTPSVTGSSVVEGHGATFLITIPKPLDYLISFDFQTKGGTALPGRDFKSLKGTLVFPAGDTKASVRVKTIDDQRDESREKFFLNVPLGCRCGTPRGGAKVLDND